MAVSPTTPGRLPSQPRLPDLPRLPEDVLTWAHSMDRAIVDLYSDIATNINFVVEVSDTAAFAATDTAVVVTFASPQVDAGYMPILTPTWNTTTWATDILTTGFTIHAGTAPGGAGATLYWGLVR